MAYFYVDDEKKEYKNTIQTLERSVAYLKNHNQAMEKKFKILEEERMSKTQKIKLNQEIQTEEIIVKTPKDKKPASRENREELQVLEAKIESSEKLIKLKANELSI